MALIVQKFGGTSVGDLDRIRNVAARVQQEVDAGHQVAVVVSAMAGTTNQLVSWARDIGPIHDAREYDTIVASGEQVTVGLLAIALQNLGIDARSWLGWQVPVRTDDVHGAARIDAIDCALMRERLAAGRWLLSPAFRGLRRMAVSQPLAVAGLTRLRWHWRRRWRLTAVTFIPMWMVSTRPIHGSRPKAQKLDRHHIRGNAGNGIPRGQGFADAIRCHGHAP